MSIPPELLPTAADLQQLLQLLQQVAISSLKAGDSNSFTPVLAVRSAGPDGTKIDLFSLQGDFNSDAGKRNGLRLLGRKFHDDQRFPSAVMLASEAWHAIASEVPPGKRPEDCPTRDEVIVMFGQTIDRQHALHASAPITRVRGQIRIGNFSEPITTVQPGLLRHFFQGFLAPVRETRARSN